MLQFLWTLVTPPYSKSKGLLWCPDLFLGLSKWCWDQGRWIPTSKKTWGEMDGGPGQPWNPGPCPGLQQTRWCSCKSLGDLEEVEKLKNWDCVAKFSLLFFCQSIFFSHQDFHFFYFVYIFRGFNHTYCIWGPCSYCFIYYIMYSIQGQIPGFMFANVVLDSRWKWSVKLQVYII